MVVSSDVELGFPRGTRDERELFLRWLRFLRGAVIRKVEGLSDEQARWTPDGALICLVGIVNHLTHVEWRWIDGGMLGQETSRSDAEFAPGRELTVELALAAYRERAAATDATVMATPLDQPVPVGTRSRLALGPAPPGQRDRSPRWPRRRHP